MSVDDRILEAIRKIVREEFPRLSFVGFFEYAITNVSGDVPNVLIDCSPTDDSIGLPELVEVQCAPSLDGMTTIPTSGLNCVVIFLNGDPTKPRIFGVDSLGVNPVARLGDQVTMFLPPLLAIQGTAAGVPFVGTIQIANPITGLISEGSGQVFTG